MNPDLVPDSIPEVALAAASALEQTLGDDALLTVGEARERIAELVEGEAARVVTVTISLTGDERASVALIVLGLFSEVLERAAPDELMLTSCIPALNSATQALGQVYAVAVDARPPHESDLASLDELDRASQWIAFPILDGEDLVACLAIHVSEHLSEPGAAVPGGNASPPIGSIDIPAEERAGGVGAYPLAAVEMGLTAELGRCRMTARELLSITPGAIIELDRAPGTPVDVVVNGTLIARGEVVVIDEEFGIRISEILHR